MTDNFLTLKITGLGHKFTLELAASTTIGNLKDEIATRTSLSPSYQRLVARGKKLDSDESTLDSLQIKDKTTILLLHNESYAADKQALDGIALLEKEMDELEKTKDSISAGELREQVTAICCKLDGIDIHGSDSLRAIRKAALKRAEAMDSSSTKEDTT